MNQIVIAGISGAIGYALANHYLATSDGARIIGLCRDPSSVQFERNFTDRVQLIPWDAADPSCLESVAQRIGGHLSEAEGVDTVIYAAGILHGPGVKPEKRLEDLGGEALALAYSVNASGFALLVKALAPWLHHKRFKRIVAVSAKVGSITDNGFGGWYAYRSSKAALNMLVRNLAIELPRKYRPLACVAIHPGTTVSPLSAPFTRSLAQLKVHQPSDTADNIAKVLSGLDENGNGQFLGWDGTVIPW